MSFTWSIRCEFVIVFLLLTIQTQLFSSSTSMSKLHEALVQAGGAQVLIDRNLKLGLTHTAGYVCCRARVCVHVNATIDVNCMNRRTT